MEHTYETSIIDVIANDIHSEWRKSWKKNPDNISGNDSRIKNGEDINRPFYDLKNPKNKHENLMSAIVGINCVLNGMSRECSSAIIHDAWVQRNQEWASDKQKISYCLLSEEEKEKDRMVYDFALKHHLLAMNIVKILNDDSLLNISKIDHI
tara:strand:+ start:284 stop:739 length:456 start_codon:yes stop_codon:yes gene_type:complete